MVRHHVRGLASIVPNGHDDRGQSQNREWLLASEVRDLFWSVAVTPGNCDVGAVLLADLRTGALRLVLNDCVLIALRMVKRMKKRSGPG